MKSLCALLSVAGLVLASPLLRLDLYIGDEQITLNSHTGFNLNLNDMRLVELEGQAPVWMSELEKVRHR
jgi:bacterial leucyl aminopeptidase